MLIFKNIYNTAFCVFISSFILLTTNCSTVKETNLYDTKITQKGVLLYFQESFYFFPLKHKNIRTTQDLFTRNINQLNGFRCEGLLNNVEIYELFMDIKPSDVTISMCEYEEVEIQPNYFEVDDFRMSLVKMTYKIRTPSSYDKTIMKKTIGYCVTTPVSQHTVKFKYNCVLETVYKIEILD